MPCAGGRALGRRPLHIAVPLVARCFKLGPRSACSPLVVSLTTALWPTAYRCCPSLSQARFDTRTDPTDRRLSHGVVQFQRDCRGPSNKGLHRHYFVQDTTKDPDCRAQALQDLKNQVLLYAQSQIYAAKFP